MAYTTIDKPSDYFNTKLYTGNGASSHAISGVGFQSDWTWIKNRSSALNHALTDSVRGAPTRLMSNTTDGDINQTTGLLSFNSDGFTVGADSGYNGNGNSIVSWNWKAGTSFTNDASSTGIGSVDSTGSVNTDAGFSIINVVKNNTTAHTVAHGLGAVPQMIIGKSRTGGSYRWIVYHQAIGNTHALYLNEDFAKTDSVTFWNDTTPTSSVFSLGTDNSWNGTNIFYCFNEVKGYSKFGSYVGNGNANGAFVYTGFRASFVMCKRSSGTGNWQMFDSKREGYNVDNDGLQANLSNAEATDDDLDILSNGFKLRGSGNDLNGSGSTYIYMAFAENPFVTSTGVPATAR